MPKGRTRNPAWCGAVMLVALLAVAVVGAIAIGCQGAIGPPGTSTGTVSGQVTNSITGGPIKDVTVATDPAISGVNITTSANGTYSAQLPIGVYTLTFKKTNFQSATQTVSLVASQTVTKNLALKPVSPVVANAGNDQGSSHGTIVTLKASADVLDGSTVTGYQWAQTAGVSATLGSPTADTISVTLGNAKAYKAELMKALNPLERFTVQAINPHALEVAEVATFQVIVTTSSGTYSDMVNVTVKLPYEVNPGLRNLPVGVPVLLHGKTQSAYTSAYKWSLVAAAGSKAALDDASDQNPSFTPDVPGKYIVTEKNSGASIDIYAGTWAGAITGIDAKGQPLATDCTGCHNGTVAPDQFTAWKASGHAEIFTQNINDPNGHWSLSCAGCHTVGYDTNANNGGFDEAVAAEGWKVPPHGEIGYWAMMVSKYPKTARLANIQCENCHGPNNTVLHPNKELDKARISLSADVCAVCHGEPPRHGRFQQWEESRHAGTETTPARAVGNASCGRCHSAQGFLTWIKQDNITLQIQGAKGNATADELAALGLNANEIQPVTCVTCHDPHAQGTTSGDPTTATVRIIDDTKLLPAGFQAKEVGKGALCMTCHNTRNALHNIDAPPTSYSAPHTAAQADVLMGENAYLVAVPQRSPHSYVKDTCVTCHMEATPPPPDYNQSGTNHSFKASTAICSTCHSATFNAHALQVGVEDKVELLAHQMGAYLLKKMPAQVTIKDYTPHDYSGKSYDVLSDALVVSKDNIVSVEPTEPHGQQGFILKFKTPVTVTYSPAGEASHSMSLTEAEVRLGDITTDGKNLISTSDVLVKVGWNYFLIHGDASEGVHNPAFINNVLDASIEALK